MAYEGKNPNFKSVILDDKGATVPANPPAGKLELYNSFGVLNTVDEAGAIKKVLDQPFVEGTYQATATLISGTTSVTFPDLTRYSVIGTTVTVWGRCVFTMADIFPAAPIRSFSINLPNPTFANFVNESDVGGVGSGGISNIAGMYDVAFGITAITGGKLAKFSVYDFNDPEIAYTSDINFRFNYRAAAV